MTLAIITPPPAMDLGYYRQAYPELNGLSDDVLREHCERFAVEQGRSTCPYDRRGCLRHFLQDTIDKQHLKALEISPWDSPFLRGENVKYFGIADSDALRKSAVEAKRHFQNVPDKIHFVSPTGDLSVVDETFDIVFSAHVIEHCPNLIAHLRGVSRILNKGGLYVLIIPDKRYCFDHYHNASTVFEVIDAFVNKQENARRVSFIGSVNGTHNNAILHWLGNHGERYGERKDSSYKEKISRLVEQYNDAVSQNKYLNAHNWQFTPDSFRYIVDMLNKLEFIKLPVYRLCHTLFGRQEFIVMLEKI